jgi:hypothetical protein
VTSNAEPVRTAGATRGCLTTAPHRPARRSPALAASPGYAWWSRRRLTRRPSRPNGVLVPLAPAALLELLTIADAAALPGGGAGGGAVRGPLPPSAAMPATGTIAVPAFVAITARLALP